MKKLHYIRKNMNIEEIKNIIKNVSAGNKGLTMGHPINEDVNYHLQQLLLKWEFDKELFDAVLTTLEEKVHTIKKYEKGEYKNTIFDHMTVEKWLSPAREVKYKE